MVFRQYTSIQVMHCVHSHLHSRSSHRPNASAIPDPTIRSVAETFLNVGETVFDMIQATAVNSAYFKRDSKNSR